MRRRGVRPDARGGRGGGRPRRGAAGSVEVIVIRRVTPDPTPTPWLDRLLTLGCAAAAMVVLLLLGTGAYTVSSWFW